MSNNELLFILKTATLIFMIVISIVIFFILKKLISKTDTATDFARKEIDNAFKKRGLSTNYRRKLSKLGVMYRTGNYNLNPSWYIMARIAVGFITVFFVYGLSESILISFVGIPIGYYLTGLYFSYKNNEDNKEMMLDLYNTYSVLKIQMEAGKYIAEIMEYAYKTASHPRYKEALEELVLNFSDKTIPMAEAVAVFRNRFDSKEIDKLCALLESCVLYGLQPSYASNIMGEIHSILSASSMESEHNIESKTGLITFAFFSIIIFIAIYSVATNLSGVNIFA